MSAVVLLYLLFGVFAYAGWGTTPAGAVLDLQADRTRPPRGREVAAAVLVWVLLLVVWPLAVVIRGVLALRSGADHREL
ncbi:hypothetical protein ACIOJE_34915 [Kitasatospora sp. NPDC087861]|uniref:hypothetical protein n=1 Tax=Kitasatospora sp. NPDC087861 TaxID=3364070 RepID=UPI00380BCBFA